MQPDTPKKINTTTARQKMIEGVQIAYEAVASSFGPRSANTAIKRPFGAPAVIHDGVNIFRSLFPFADEEQGTGAEIAFNAAEKTAQIGDGTTLATILTYEVAREAHKRMKPARGPWPCVRVSSWPPKPYWPSWKSLSMKLMLKKTPTNCSWLPPYRPKCPTLAKWWPTPTPN
jgi:hypothetical protein